MPVTKRLAQKPVIQRGAPGRLAELIAQEAWRLYSRNGRLDWVGVEHHLGGLVDRARRAVRRTDRASTAAMRGAPRRGVDGGKFRRRERTRVGA